MNKLKEKFFRKTMRSLEECLVLVEGKRDEEALEKIGLRTTIVKAVGKSEAIIKKIKALNKPVVLLFDYDDEGVEKTRFFSEALASEGIKCDALLRKKFKMLFKVSCIEETPYWFDELVKELS